MNNSNEKKITVGAVEATTESLVFQIATLTKLSAIAQDETKVRLLKRKAVLENALTSLNSLNKK